MGTIEPINGKDLPEIKQDIIKLNQTIEKVKNATQFGKVAIAENAMEQIAGLQVSMFEYLDYLEGVLAKVTNEVDGMGMYIQELERKIKK